MAKDIFMMVMEAEGDMLQSFDEAPAGTDNDAPAEADTAASSDQPADPESDTTQSVDDPPPLSADEDASFDDTTTDTDNNSDDSTDESSDENKEDKKLSKKANDILNQRLYQQMSDRNNEINEIINNMQIIVPVLPYDIVQSNDISLNRLKAALLKGQQYVINNFVDSGYGENLLFYQKLDSLYTLLLNSIDANLKKIKNN